MVSATGHKDSLPLEDGARRYARLPVNPNLDANGLPWDKRIHSSSRAKVAGGTWRYARNLDKALIATVEAELRAVQAIPVPAVVATVVDGVEFPHEAAPMTAAPTGWPFATHGHDALPIVPLPPTSIGVSDLLPPATLPMTFAQLMQHVTPLLVSGKLTQQTLQQAVEKCGLPHLAALGARPDLVETVKAAIDAAVGGVQ